MVSVATEGALTTSGMAQPPCHPRPLHRLRGLSLRCISYYCETIGKVDRLPELCRWARSCNAPVLLLQGLASGVEQFGDVESFMKYVSARSRPTKRDGVLALCTKTCARSEVAAVHELHRGKALEVWVKGLRGKRELGLYLISANAPVATAAEDEAVSAASASFWQALELGTRRVTPA